MSRVLDEVSVGELVSGKKKLVYAELHDSLSRALQLLADNNILAVPVREEQQQQESAKEEYEVAAAKDIKFCGQLSVLDIAAFVSRESEASPGAAEEVEVSAVMRRTAESWHMLLLDPHASVGRAMEFLGVRGFHRALVPNVCLSPHPPSPSLPLPSVLLEEVSPSERGEEYRVLSQMDLARFILKFEGRFGLALAQTIEAVGLEGGRVLATTRDEKLSEALDRMAGHAVSALAVVDKLDPHAPWAVADALLLDTLSASDLRGCSLSDLKDARRITVGEFLAPRHGVPPRKLLTCTKASVLRSVLQDMVDQGVHRLWVTPEAFPGKPGSPPLVHGVVTLSDVVRIMRILPVTNNAEPEEVGEGFQDAEGQFLWMEWMI